MLVADLRQLRPVEAVRLVNSTPIGTVVDEWTLRQDMGSLGYRIAPDGQRLNVIHYTAWLAHARHLSMAARQSTASGAGDDYARKREREAVRARESARSTRDIGDIPPIKNDRRRRKARKSLKYFLETYFPEIFEFDWSSDHLELINISEDLLKHGGQHTKAMWRGAGKSTIFECALVWATLEGYRRYALLLANTATQANQSFDTIKTHLEANEGLGEDYPEICYPIRCLEGIAQRANAQLYQGERTYLRVADKVLIYPRIPGAIGSSAILRVTSLDSSFRGVGYLRPDGKKARPDAVLIDDPQTDESARSQHQCDERERLIQGGVLGTAGLGKSMAAVMACTVICQGDLSSRYLDRKRHPAWRGRSAKLVIEWPKASELWEEYAKVWQSDIEAGDTRHKRATSFYRKNRRAMDEGAVVAWPDAYERGVELSAIQSVWNMRLRLKDPAFFAECQNEPLPDRPQASESIDADVVCKRVNGIEPRVVPLAAHRVTAFIDVQGTLLYWLVAAWEDDFTGAVIDYGTWPKQPIRIFALANAPRKFVDLYPGMSVEAQVGAALGDLTEQLLGDRAFVREDGTRIGISRCLIDANWGPSRDVVYEFARRSPYASRLIPSHGRFIGPTSRPMAEYQRKEGDRVGLNWRIPASHGSSYVRHLIYDTNFWKSFISARLSVPVRDRGAVSFWGRDVEFHRPLAEQLSAEVREDVESKGRVVAQWNLRRPNIDNHWFDALVGCAVAGSIEGCSLPGLPNGPRQRRVKYVNFAARGLRDRS